MLKVAVSFMLVSANGASVNPDGGRSVPVGGGAGSRERLPRLLQRLELAGANHRAARAWQRERPQIELAAIEQLVVAGGLTMDELGDRLGLTSGGVTALAGRLRDAGYITRGPHPNDRRMRVLTPTAAGEALLAEHLEPIVASSERATSWLSASDVDLLERLLDALVLVKERAAADTPGPARRHCTVADETPAVM